MAKAKQTKSSSGAKVSLNPKKSHKGVHAKSNTSKNKKSKNYKKPYNSQGK